MQPSHKHHNSETKKVGDTGNTFIKNLANPDLKESHMPFARQDSQTPRPSNY